MGTVTVQGRDELGRLIDVTLTTTADVAPPGPEVAEGGASGVPDPSGAPDGQVLGTLSGEYELLSEIHAVDDTTSASGEVSVAAQEDGTAQASIDASAQLNGAGTVYVLAVATEGAALVQIEAESSSGTAQVRVGAPLVAGPQGADIVGMVASAVSGVAESLVIADGVGEVGAPGDVLSADATVGSKWLPPADPLTSDGVIVISAADEANVLTLGADGSFEVSGSGVVRLLSLPSADPEVAGQLYTNGAPSGGVPQALMVSGGPA